MTNQIIQGDARQTGLPDAFFHCVATSPPYFGLREYGDDDREIGDEKSPNEYIDEMRKVGREVWRVLRDDGTWWLNLGDSFANDAKWGGYTSGKATAGNHGSAGNGRGKRFTGVPGKSLLMIPQRVALALQADGWIVRAQIPWIKASCMPESVRDRPTVAHEYVFLLVKLQRYFWDADAVRMPQSLTSHGGKCANAGTKQTALRDTSSSTLGQVASKLCGARNLRTSDFFHTGLDEYAAHLAHVRENGGLLLSPDGDPLAFMVNPVPNKLAHFAMWPPRLVAPMIKASTSEKGCCPKCGAQWRRVVEKGAMVASGPNGLAHKPRSSNRAPHASPLEERPVDGYGDLPRRERTLLGWSHSCECNAGDPVPCRVLDPFAGSGTTMQVCESLRRDSWGVELMAKNIPIIGERLKEKLDPESMRPISKHRVADASATQRSLF